MSTAGSWGNPQTGLGHKHGFTTEIYADADHEKVMDVFARVG